MKAELRADGLHISGYVNVPGRESRPVLTPVGKVIEVIEQRAFDRAIRQAAEIKMKLDHEKEIATTKDGTLTVYEDNVGLRAEAVVTDRETIEGAKSGKLKGWSFEMSEVRAEIEQREHELPLRRVKGFKLKEVSLIMNKKPFYASTSIELRAGEEEETEIRAQEAEKVEVRGAETPDYSAYESRIQQLEKEKAE